MMTSSVKLALFLGCITIALAGCGNLGQTAHTHSPVNQAIHTKNASHANSSMNMQISQDGNPPVLVGQNQLPRPSEIVLNVSPQDQLPQLPNGCEVTSLSMLFDYVGHPVSKMTLAKEVLKDPQPLVLGTHKQIVAWGDPNKGFVGKIDANPGYGVYHKPMIQLINQILPDQAEDLSHHPFSDILDKVANEMPVVVWTNTTFKPLPPSQWITWQSPEGTIRATFDEHAVLVVGYSKNYVYINNPLNGDQDERVDRQAFVASWKQMGEQAVTVH
jgi:uncharacterized protein YvpB